MKNYRHVSDMEIALRIAMQWIISLFAGIVIHPAAFVVMMILLQWPLVKLATIADTQRKEAERNGNAL